MIQADAVPRSAGAPGGNLGFLSVVEPLDLAHSGRLLERARPLYTSCGCLVLDLGGSEFIDSDGVRSLLRLAEELEADGKELRLVTRPTSRVRRTLDLLQLLDRFHTFETVADACDRRHLA